MAWSESRVRARLQTLRWFAPGFALFSLLRIPSFMEPHWYTDEGSYVSVGRALLRGQVLYAQIWNNKPPLQSWTVALEVRLFGSSEAGLHVLTFLSGVLALSAVAWAAWRVLSPRRALVATLIAATALGLPVLDAELALPESLLIAPLAWAGAIVVVNLDPRRTPPRTGRWALLAGALTAAAIAYQQTAVAELGALTLAILLSPQARRRDALIYVGTALVITFGWVGLAMSQAGAAKVAFALVGFYIPYTQSVFPASGGGIAAHLAEIGAAGALLVAGAWLSRRLRTPEWILILWAGASLMIPALSRQPYAHYLTPAVVPMALLLASLPALKRSWRPARASLFRLGPQVAGLLITTAMASVAGLDWIPAASPSPSLNSSRTLAMYYGGAARAAVDGDERQGWSGDFDARVDADEDVAEWLAGQGLTGVSAVLWSSDPWLYALADLDEQVPTPPIYNDEVLFGINGPLADQVDIAGPTLIIVADDALTQFPEVSRLLDGSRYQRVFQSGPDTVWVRNDVVAAAS